jgi:hypothetical protein
MGYKLYAELLTLRRSSIGELQLPDIDNALGCELENFSNSSIQIRSTCNWLGKCSFNKNNEATISLPDLLNFFGTRMHLLNLLSIVYLGVQQSLQRPSLAITASTEDPVQGAGLDLSCQLVGGEVRGSALSWHKVGSQLASNVFTRGNLLRY